MLDDCVIADSIPIALLIVAITLSVWLVVLYYKSKMDVWP